MTILNADLFICLLSFFPMSHVEFKKCTGHHVNFIIHDHNPGYQTLLSSIHKSNPSISPYTHIDIYIYTHTHIYTYMYTPLYT